jgi:hypothetical protein
VVAVGDERRAREAVARARADLGRDAVARVAQRAGKGQGAERIGRVRVDEPVDRLVPGDTGAHEDRADDGQATARTPARERLIESSTSPWEW